MNDRNWIDQPAIKEKLAAYFAANKNELSAFGRTVNQTFEAFVFAQVIRWYESKGWKVEMISPSSTPDGLVRLKFSTRGRPDGYTYARCVRGLRAIQIRHGLRVATKFHKAPQRPLANVCLDVAVIRDSDLSGLGTNDHLENRMLITFGEAKHMSAFAELIAGFIGLVHEMMPDRLQSGGRKRRLHLRPFLYVSGFLYPTARGMLLSMRARNLDIDVFDRTDSAFPDALPIWGQT